MVGRVHCLRISIPKQTLCMFWDFRQPTFDKQRFNLPLCGPVRSDGGGAAERFTEVCEDGGACNRLDTLHLT